MENSIMLLLAADFYSLHPSVQKKAFVELYRQIYPFVLGILNDHADAEDIVQEVFLKAINKPPVVEDETHLRAWLKVVARNTALNFIKKNKINRNYSELDTVFINTEIFISEQESVERNVEVKMLEEEILFYLSKLKPDYRRLIELKWRKELSYKEIAEEMNLNFESTAH